MLRKGALIITVAGLLLSSGWMCLAVPHATGEFTLPIFDGRPFSPRISGNWVAALQEEMIGNRVGKCLGVKCYNLADGSTHDIYNSSAGPCEISGTMVTWTGTDAGIKASATLSGENGPLKPGCNLLAYDLVSQRYYRPTLDTGPASMPAILGNRIAYTGKNKQIYFVDLATGEQKQISITGADNRDPDMCGDFLVWNECAATSQRQIRGYRFSTGKVFDITNDPGANHFMPHTDGNYAVWDLNNKEVWGCNLRTGKKFKVADGFFSDISQGVAVYVKEVGEREWIVYGKALPTGKEFRISKDVTHQGPSIDGNRVVWCKERTIHWAEISLR